MRVRLLVVCVFMSMSCFCVYSMVNQQLKIKLQAMKGNLVTLNDKLKRLTGMLEGVSVKLGHEPVQKVDQWPLSESLASWAKSANVTLVHLKSLQQDNSWICGYYAMYNAKFITDKIKEACDKGQEILTFLDSSLKSKEYSLDNFKTFQEKLAKEIYGENKVQKFKGFYVPKLSVEKGSVSTDKAMLKVVNVDLAPQGLFIESEFREKFNEIYTKQTMLFLDQSGSAPFGKLVIAVIVDSNSEIGVFSAQDIDSITSAQQFTAGTDKIFLNKLIKKFGEIPGYNPVLSIGFLDKYFNENKFPDNDDMKKICEILIEMKKEQGSGATSEKVLVDILAVGKPDFTSSNIATTNTQGIGDRLKAICQSPDFGYLGIVRLGDEHFVMLSLVNPGQGKSKIIILMDSFNTQFGDASGYTKHVVKPIKELAHLAGLPN